MQWLSKCSIKCKHFSTNLKLGQTYYIAIKFYNLNIMAEFAQYTNKICYQVDYFFDISITHAWFHTKYCQNRCRCSMSNKNMLNIFCKALYLYHNAHKLTFLVKLYKHLKFHAVQLLAKKVPDTRYNNITLFGHSRA